MKHLFSISQLKLHCIENKSVGLQLLALNSKLITEEQYQVPGFIDSLSCIKNKTKAVGFLHLYLHIYLFSETILITDKAILSSNN